MTSSPRLSYFGVQIAVAFCLIHLNSFAIEPSLSIARDRVVGILLGLVMMWFVFDQLWTAPAVVEMKKAFISVLRLLAQFAREPVSADARAAIGRSNSLRDTISGDFDSVRASADVVLFEFGPSRNQDLAWRREIREWQPQLRLLFLAEIALWKYRARVPGFELPESVRVAQRAFDDELARKLAELADRMEGRSPGAKPREEWLAPLERTVRTYDANEPQKQTAIRLQAFLSLHRRVENITTSLRKDLNVI